MINAKKKLDGRRKPRRSAASIRASIRYTKRLRLMQSEIECALESRGMAHGDRRTWTPAEWVRAAQIVAPRESPRTLREHTERTEAQLESVDMPLTTLFDVPGLPEPATPLAVVVDEQWGEEFER